ncbi:ECF transporter S component [Tepidanaerobacter syntrophicus]|uniref:ECF transporter S component n=1 Tax=Tepidanaerobacter syntrophicus TaxID=224999 RepID=UPI001BD3B9AD|nr:ECF transporter S component [Tepidanaerobacter syntrophicus]
MKTDFTVNRRYTRTLTVSGLLGALSVVLGLTPLGFIPVPTAAGHATIMHVPAILGAVLEGPTTGALTGLIFGLYSLLRASSPLFADPLIALVPRILIGVVTYQVYRLTHSDGLAAACGSMTNTLGVMGLAVLRGYVPAPAALIVVLTHGIPEMVVAVVITVIICKAMRKSRR